MTVPTDDLVLVMTWLMRHPEEMAALKTCATLDYEPDTIWPDVNSAASATLRREAERYFQSGFYGWCSICGIPCVTFADGIRIEWKTRERHHCAEPQPRYRAVAV